MQYNTLIQNIQADIYSNGAELITGDILQSVLLQMVNAWASAGAMYGGVITPASAAPADLNQATVYLALTAGTYTNFIDGGGNPIVTTGPALITYDGGASLVFAKTDLPSGGSGATVITNDGTDGDAVAIRLTDNYSYKRSFRIDMTAEYTGGANEQRIGSLIIECYSDATDDICHGYYYGDDMSDILTEVAVYQDDIDPDIFYLMLTHESSLDSVTFAISPTDGGDVDAIITNAADDHTKMDDANIRPVGSGGGDGKMGVISQTQTWTTVPSVNAPGVYAMSNLVTGLIPQANIDLYEAAGATFNTSTGYFELNGLTDISYNEMSAIYAQNVPNPWTGQQGMFTYGNIRTNIPPKNNIAVVTPFSGLRLAYGAGQIERIILKSIANKVQLNNLQLAFFNLFYLSELPDEIDVTNATNFTQAFQSCYSLKEIRLYKLKASLTFEACSGLSKDSLLYMINNSQTTAFTITLHASVYAKTQSGGEWYSDINTALSAHPNVSLASA